jgi:L-alanine-DL-glutamate epimerase-like enolase superfamily enzyme
MGIDQLRPSELHIPFKATFRHASAERSETSSIWVEATSEGLIGYGESCPRPYVTGETTDSARAFVREHEGSIRREVTGLDSLRGWMAAHAEAIDRNPAAWCAVELALIDLMARASHQTLEAFLSLTALAGPFRYTAILGDASEASFATTADRYRRMGFTDFKVKLSGDIERDRAKLAVLAGFEIPEQRVRVDANNLWPEPEVAISYLRSLGAPLFGVEEPIGSRRYAELSQMSVALGCRIILDESLVSADQLDALEGTPDQWVINVRVSKMGGLLRSLAVVQAARERGIQIIVGAQVGETSVLTRAALTVAQEARTNLLGQEGAFGTFLLEHDVCEPSLMFGAGGVLDVQAYPSLEGAGFGLRITNGPR